VDLAARGPGAAVAGAVADYCGAKGVAGLGGRVLPGEPLSGLTCGNASVVAIIRWGTGSVPPRNVGRTRTRLANPSPA
jgi:hypothetical protein